MLNYKLYVEIGLFEIVKHSFKSTCGTTQSKLLKYAGFLVWHCTFDWNWDVAPKVLRKRQPDVVFY